LNIEEVRKQSIEQFAALRRKALFEAQQNSPIVVNAAAGASGGGSTNVETATNFDITANWSLTQPAVVDEATFKTFLESGEDGDGDTNSLTDVVITDFSLVGNRLTCNLFANGDGLYLGYVGVSDADSIGSIVGLENLTLEGNEITNFDPSIPLPSSLLTLKLGNNQIIDFDPTIALPNLLELLELFDNQIVTFNPSIPLPSSLLTLNLGNNQIIDFDPTIGLPNTLTYLNLEENQIITFNPSIALPNSLEQLSLGDNQMTTAGYTASEPWASAMTNIPGRGDVYFNGNINSASGTNLETILIAKGWNVVV
jgi:Leucine-rich repeat (LRR) protein